MRPALLLVAVLCLPVVALAGAPEPRKPLDLTRFMGRWYEQMRIPNLFERDCHAAHQDWSQVSPGRFMILQTCHGGSDEGPERQVRTPAHLVDPTSRAKFEASFFGGLVRKRYWVLDHADGYGWMIASTDDGRFGSILARRAELPAEELVELKARAAALGLPAGKLVFVGRPRH